MCSCDFEYPTLSSVEFPIARKPHRCDECDRTIAPGQKYRIDRGLLDRDWYQSKTCGACQTLVWWADRESGGTFCFALGELHSDLLECDLVGWDNHECEYIDVPDELLIVDGRLWPSPELSIAHEIAMAIDDRRQDDRNRESWRSHIGRQVDAARPDQICVVRLPEIHAVGHTVGAIVTAEFGRLSDIQAKHSSMDVVSIDEYPEYIAQMIRSAIRGSIDD